MTTSPPRDRRGFEDVVAIETPEMTLVSYTIAGVGSRVAAGLIDLLVCMLFLIGLGVLGWLVGDDGTPDKRSSSDMWALAILMLIQFAIVWGYYVLFEALNDGQTPGKKLFKLRVVMDGGYSIQFSASAIRNIVRLLDIQPVIFAAVGIVSIAASRSGKRIGDRVAGTMVVREQPLSIPVSSSISKQVDPHPAALKTVLTEAEYDVLARFMKRRSTIGPDDRSRLVERLAARFRGRLAELNDRSDAAYLLQLYERETAARESGGAAHRASGAERERHAILSEGVQRWSAFAARVKAAQRRGLGAMSESELSSFVAAYREISNDLARLRTATRNTDPAAVFSLSRSVAAAHNLIYRGKRIPAGRILEFLAFDVPREVRRSSAAILLSAGLFFIPMAITYVATSRSYRAATEILPPAMLERAEAGIERARSNRGYIEDPKAARPVMGSFIIANNIQVAFVVFAFGITVLGTVYGLFFNGATIGAVFGLYQNKGILSLLLRFVAPHSVLELSAITIAGAAGLLIAAAVLIPGNRTRAEAIVVNGKRAMRLLTCVIMFLLVAGSLEGLVSPIPTWPLLWKGSVALGTLVLMLAYLSLGFRQRPTDLRAP